MQVEMYDYAFFGTDHMFFGSDQPFPGRLYIQSRVVAAVKGIGHVLRFDAVADLNDLRSRVQQAVDNLAQWALSDGAYDRIGFKEFFLTGWVGADKAFCR